MLLDNDEASEIQIAGKSFIRKVEPHEEGTYLLYYTLNAGKWVGLQVYETEITPELEEFMVSIVEGFIFP
jgi:hypothetical protein